jgi:5-formyltetrahydrofolate cyclo-ligase
VTDRQDPEGSADVSDSKLKSKADLREKMRARLAKITTEERETAESRIARRVVELPEIVDADGILSCLSFGTEVDTRRVIERLMEAGKELYVPRAQDSDHTLHVHPWPCSLVTLPMGLRQPPAGEPELAAERIADRIDAVLVLGLAFERHRGWRLGHGGGYFDRFLSAHPGLLPVALAFECQLVDALPLEPHDRPMGLVVTEERVIRFAGDDATGDAP